MSHHWLLVICALLLVPNDVQCTATLILTSQPQTSGTYCPGPVTFTCVGTEINNLFWLVNGSTVASYAFQDDDMFPLTLGPLTPPLSGVTAVVISVFTNPIDDLNITSVLSVDDISVLNDASLQCMEVEEESEIVNIDVDDSISPPRLTATNQGLLAVGVVACFLAVVVTVTVVYLVLVRRKFHAGLHRYAAKRKLSFLVFDILLSLVVVVMWIATFIHVGTQTDICNSKWQSARDGLIIATFIISVLACVIVILLAIVDYCSKKRKDKLKPSSPQPIFNGDQSEGKEQSEVKSKQNLEMKGGGFGTIEPIWSRDEDHDECQLCETKLYRCWPGYGRHDCCACGKVVCGPCSKYKAYLQHSKKTERVCKYCFKESKGEFPGMGDKPEEVETTHEDLQRQSTPVVVDIVEDPTDKGNIADMGNEFRTLPSEVPPKAESGAAVGTNETQSPTTTDRADKDFEILQSPEDKEANKKVTGGTNDKNKETTKGTRDGANDKGKETKNEDIAADGANEEPNKIGFKKPRMVPYGDNTKCISCKKMLILQCCPACGKVVCNKCCVKKEAPIFYSGKCEIKKVCNNCYEEYDAEYHREHTAELRSLGKERPTFMRFEDARKCAICQTELPHQCPGCGQWVCSTCSEKEALLQYSGKTERVCDLCHKEITGSSGSGSDVTVAKSQGTSNDGTRSDKKNLTKKLRHLYN